MIVVPSLVELGITFLEGMMIRLNQRLAVFDIIPARE